MRHYGRHKILTDLIPNGDLKHDKEIIPQIIEKSITLHNEDVVVMNTLYDYYFNKTKILNKTKKSRPDINSKVSKPICRIACWRKNNYCFGKPFLFISSEAETNKQEEVQGFNNALRADNYDKNLTDVTLKSSWAGLGYKYVEKPTPEEIEEGIYFKTVTDIDPRQAFCVYANTITKEKVLGVIYYDAEKIVKEDGIDVTKPITVYNVFTKWHKWIFECDNGVYTVLPFNITIGQLMLKLNGFPYMFTSGKEPTEIIAQQRSIPLIEYQRNTDRINDFELAIDLIDASNEIISSAVDKIRQNVDYVLKLRDIDVGEWDEEGKNPRYETIMRYLQANILPVKSNEGATTQPDIDILDVPLNITQVRDLLSFIKQEIYEALFIPTREGSVGGDTGKAVERRNGFTELEDFAGITVSCAKAAEREFLKVALEIASNIDECPFKNLKAKEVIIKDARSTMEDMQTSSQSFATLINSGVNRVTAYEITKLVADAIDTAKLDEAYEEAQAKKLQERELSQQKELKKLEPKTQETEVRVEEQTSEDKDVIETVE